MRHLWKMRKLMVIVAALLLTLTACMGGGKNNVNEPENGTTPPVQENDAAKGSEIPQLAIEGEIIDKTDTSLIVTTYMEQGGEDYIDAYALTVDEETVMSDASGATVDYAELTIGSRVEAWSVGPVAESYPMQAKAAKIVLLEEPSELPVSRADAVRAAIEAQTELAGPWSVKEASLSEEQDYWTIVLVHHMYIDEPVTVRIDAEDAEILPNIAAENEAFRIYSPKPDTVVDNAFVVEGEARVFEGAFRWMLEDGHRILQEGYVDAEAGAPAWGRFQFEVSYDKASQPNLMLILYVSSAKDGSMQDELIIPLKAQEEHIEYNSGSID